MIMMPYNRRRLALAVAAGHTACRLLAPHRRAPARVLMPSAVSTSSNELRGWFVQGMRITSERTPASRSNSALPSVVSRMRFVAAAVAAIIKS